MQISLHVVVVNLSQTLALLNDSSHSDLSDIIEEEEGSDCDQKESPGNHMAVPHIEITKDSSGSVSATDEEVDQSNNNNNNSNSNNKPSPSSPTQDHFFPIDPSNNQPRSAHQPEGELTDTRYNNEVRPLKIREDIPEAELIDYEDDGDSEEEAAERTLFVALFDYDPQTMSPNRDCCDDELGFKEGQLITVIGDKDSDGFYQAEVNGRRGYVPGNMVTAVDVAQQPRRSSRTSSGTEDNRWNRAPKHSPTHSYSESGGGGGGGGSGGGSGGNGGVGHGHHYHHAHRRTSASSGRRARSPFGRGRIRRMRALFNYFPSESSPNVDADMELSFRQDDIIMVIGDIDADGFFMGELDGKQGLVPSNYLKELDDFDNRSSPLTSSQSKDSVNMASDSGSTEYKPRREQEFRRRPHPPQENRQRQSYQRRSAQNPSNSIKAGTATEGPARERLPSSAVSISTPSSVETSIKIEERDGPVPVEMQTIMNLDRTPKGGERKKSIISKGKNLFKKIAK
ncbi:DgyrCDS9627 [Dimorphilus gyrociliatus]|uniref:DgyrCDS9627 n=1 Tax=Dimorphilus gyrociliatus TaxID=2664684 RepID=A0A7I8W2U6_9ANNE|nr:DgyrCDS9627 [Dimorphilus gyrociliatus]